METNTHCPGCESPIPLIDSDVAKDIALCRSCKTRWSHASLMRQQSDLTLDLTLPPDGAWFRGNPIEFEVGASIRDPNAMLVAELVCGWFVASLAIGIRQQLHRGEFSWGNFLFDLLWFLAALACAAIAWMFARGKVVVKVEVDRATCFAGVGPLVWRHTIPWDKVTSIARSYVSNRRGRERGRVEFSLNGKRDMSFASMAESRRMDFMVAALRQKLRERGR